MQTARVFALILLLCSTLFAAQAPADRITTTEVAPNFFRIVAEGKDAEIAAYVEDDGVVVVDTGLKEIAPKLLDAVRAISAKPIRYVVLTHYHFDHIGGAELFAATAPVVAHENTRRRMMLPSYVAGRNDPPAPAAALPDITFDRALTLFVGTGEVRMLSFAAHTDSDAVLWFPRANLVHVGDAVLGIDNSAGGDVYGMAEVCERVAALVPADAKVLVSHAGVITVAELAEQGKQWRQAGDVVKAAIAAGKSLEQMRKEEILKPVFGRPAPRVTETIYKSLSATK